MQAAFIDIGLQRTAFLHASDAHPTDAESEEVDIRDLLRDGDMVLVQIVKEPIGDKGARLTTQISLPSRYLVMMPGRPTVGVSSRIEDSDERERLRQLVATEAGFEHGFIVRTAAEGSAAEILHADISYLKKLWAEVSADAVACGGIENIHAEQSLAIRVVRDISNQTVDRIRVDSNECLQEIVGFTQTFMPDPPSIELYEGRRPIFDLYAVDDEINRALDRSVPLKSGGNLIIEQTEAMSTIDVNTGAYVGRSNQEETIYRTNLEAVAAIARQLRLRNLGGIIILDFIDMQSEAHRQQVLEALETSLADDSARNQISHVSPLGLIEMTRRRTRESLEHILCESCPGCDGRGHVKTAETVCFEVYREILRQHRQFPSSAFVVIAHDNVIEMLLDEESRILLALEESTGRNVRLQAQSMNAKDEFDVVPV